MIIDTIYGNGRLPTNEDISLDSQTGSKYLIKEWGHPDIGIIFGMTDAGGEDALIIVTEPSTHPAGSIVLSDEFGDVLHIANSVAEFLSRLEEE
jgi:hypothetical protein